MNWNESLFMSGCVVVVNSKSERAQQTLHYFTVTCRIVSEASSNSKRVLNWVKFSATTLERLATLLCFRQNAFLNLLSGSILKTRFYQSARLPKYEVWLLIESVPQEIRLLYGLCRFTKMWYPTLFLALPFNWSMLNKIFRCAQVNKGKAVSWSMALYSFICFG